MITERFKVCPEDYYQEMTAEIEAGKPTWVSNLEIAGPETWHGFFSDKQLRALVRVPDLYNNSYKMYPMIYLIKDGKPLISRTAHNLEDAVRWVETEFTQAEAE